MVRGGNYQIQKLFGAMSQYLRGKFFVVCGALTLLEVYLPEAEVGFQGYWRKGRRKSPPPPRFLLALQFCLISVGKLEGGMRECDIPLMWGRDGGK